MVILFTFLAVVSALLFPWPLTGVLALVVAPFEPLVPLGIGLVLDALYYAPDAHAFPLFSLYGAVVTIVAYLVRRRLRAGIIR